MKLLSALVVGSTVTAVIIPDDESLFASFKKTGGGVATLQDSADDGFAPYQHIEHLESILESTASSADEPIGGVEDLLERLAPALDVLDNIPIVKQPDFTNIGESVDGEDKEDLTIYQIISKSEHTKVFSKILSKFDDLVKKLNSSDSEYTVFVPGDLAFKRFRYHHPKPPKELLRAFVEYHIVNKSLPMKDIFALKTIPTILHQEELGPYPQRISTQLGLRGVSLNFISHFIRRNIGAANGFIHAIDHFLIPPFLASDTLNFLTAQFGSFEFGLEKTGLFKEINKTSTHTGATIFAPSNAAFRKLPPPVNGFLFSRWGEKYLKALLKYHIVFDRTLYSDAYNKPEDEKQVQETIHIDLPTLLKEHHLSIDIAHVNRFYSIKVNGFSTVAIADVVVRDGVIQVVNDVLIPPRKPGKGPHDSEADIADLTVEELKTRLEQFIE